MQIRIATTEDAVAIREIYAPYVMQTAVSFEYEVPSVQEFEKRISNTLKEYPYLVAIQNDRVVGYAYAGPFHTRDAYKHCAELSIYLNQDVKRNGIGRALYTKIEEILIKQNICTVHACIASPDGEDEHLTGDSEQFHAKMGFKLAGRHEACGFKFGKWYSIVWMDKVIGERTENPDSFIPFRKIEESLVASQI